MLSLSFSGCEPHKPVRVHRVHKSRSAVTGLRVETNRMLVGIFETESSTWFFKILAEESAIKTVEPQFLKFLGSVTFEDDQPQWVAPSDWKKSGPRSMRFATLLIPQQQGQQIELAISSLGPNQNLVNNANRWLRQLSLPEIKPGEIASVISGVDNGKLKYKLFDARGTGAGTMSGAPFAGNSSPPKNPSPTSSVQFDPMEGWDQGKSNSMVRLRLSKSSGDGKATLTVVRLPANRNFWVPNIERWCGQLEVTLSEEEIKARTESIQIDQIESKLIRLVDDLETESDQRIVGAMVKKDDGAWFIKMMGDAKLVTTEVDAFLKFCQSLKLP